MLSLNLSHRHDVSQGRPRKHLVVNGGEIRNVGRSFLFRTAIILIEHLYGVLMQREHCRVYRLWHMHYVKSCNIRRLQKCIRERAVPARAMRLSPASGIAYIRGVCIAYTCVS